MEGAVMIFQDIPIQLAKEAETALTRCLQYTKPELFVLQKKSLPAVQGRYSDPGLPTDPSHRICP